MKNSTRKAKAKVLAKLTISLALITAVISGSMGAMFASAISYKNPEDVAGEGAKAMLVANVFKKCIPHIYKLSDVSGMVAMPWNDLMASWSEIYKSSAWYSDWDTTKIGTGVYVEDITQGEVDNGSVYCSQAQNLPDMFASVLGINKKRLFCDEDHEGQAGLLAAAKVDKGFFTDTYYALTTDCGNSDDYFYNDGQSAHYTNGEDYIAHIWNKYKDPKWPNWDKVNDYTDKDVTGMYAYFMYRTEFKVFCTKDEYEKGRHGSGSDTLLGTNETEDVYKSEWGSYAHLDGMKDVLGGNKESGGTGGIVYRFYSDKTDGTITDGFAAGEEGKDCNGLVGKINEFAPYYQKYVQDLTKNECKNGLESNRAAWEAILNDDEATQEEKDAAQTNIDNLDDAKSKGYVENTTEAKDGIGGIKCIDLPTVEPVRPDDPENEGPAGETPHESNACFDLNAGGSLGWIVCPILEGASKAVDGLYDMMVEPFLKIEAGIMAMSQTDADGNQLQDGSGNPIPNGTYVGWQIFQNMANIAAIVFLLVLIFSQVTGVGIDNYGIKKALPKVIIALILINLSFIICQAAVDLSNIFGKGLKDMFDGLGQQVSNYTIPPAEDSSGVPATLASGAIIVALVGLLIAFPGVVASLAMSILPALLGGVIAALIAVLMLFVLLTARKIAVIVLVVLSPLAVVCYMLPNTKKLFDKWLLFLKNMLLMFPICGIVIGGGNFVSRIILTSGTPSFINALAGLAAGIVPFFFVPTLLKGSMNILGNIGTKLSGFGKNMSHRASGALNNSDRMKDTQKRLSMARNQQIYDHYQKRLDKGKTLSGYQQRRMNNARLAYNTAAREDIDAAAGGSILRGQALAAAKQEETIKQEEKAIAEQATLISTASGFDKENGSEMYRQAKAARAAADAARRAGNTAEAEIQDHRADAYIDLAGRTGKSASQFANALRNDTGHELSEKSAKRIMNGDGSKMFKATDGIAFQYAREVYNGDAATKGQTKVDTWTGDSANIRKAVEKNINNQESYNSQSADALKLLNSNMTDIRSADASMADELEYFAAGAIENSSDLSKSAEYKAMQNGRQTREREAQAAQTAAQVGAAAAQTAAINAQAQQNFESQHMMNAELKQQRTKSTTFDIPEGYTPDLTRPGMYKNSSGRHYDPTKNKFF